MLFLASPDLVQHLRSLCFLNALSLPIDGCEMVDVGCLQVTTLPYGDISKPWARRAIDLPKEHGAGRGHAGHGVSPKF